MCFPIVSGLACQNPRHCSKTLAGDCCQGWIFFLGIKRLSWGPSQESSCEIYSKSKINSKSDLFCKYDLLIRVWRMKQKPLLIVRITGNCKIKNRLSSAPTSLPAGSTGSIQHSQIPLHGSLFIGIDAYSACSNTLGPLLVCPRLVSIFCIWFTDMKLDETCLVRNAQQIDKMLMTGQVMMKTTLQK